MSVKLGKGDLDCLDKIIKDELRGANSHGKQASDERLYEDRREGGRGMRSFKDVYNETRTRVACYLATATNHWLRKAWENEYDKEQTSLKKEVDEMFQRFGKNVKFRKGIIEWDEERYDNWKLIWRKLKREIKVGAREMRLKNFGEKKMQSEITSGYTKEDYGWLKCDTDPRKTASIFTMVEQMVETRAWKKIRGIAETYSCRLCGERKETVQHLLSGCKKIAATEYVRRHDNALNYWRSNGERKKGC